MRKADANRMGMIASPCPWGALQVELGNCSSNETLAEAFPSVNRAKY